MKVLSIDVGMKNLAYCLFNITDDLKYTIEKWEVLNLCNSENIICMGYKKNKEKCDKNAKYCKNLHYYCKNHAKNKGYKIPSNDINIKKIEKLKISLLKQFADKYSIPYEKKVKKVNLYEIIKTHIDENYFEFVSKTKASDFNLVEYGRELKKQFTETQKPKRGDVKGLVAVEVRAKPKRCAAKAPKRAAKRGAESRKITDFFGQVELAAR